MFRLIFSLNSLGRKEDLPVKIKEEMFQKGAVKAK